MGRTVALRKCGEHEACQLQSLNGGEWQHTPARTPLANRLATKPEEIKELEARLAGEVGQAIELRVHLGEQLEHLKNRLKYLEGVAEGMPALQNLLAEADRLNGVVKGEQGKLVSKASRLERDMERLDRLTGKLEVVAQETAERSRKAERDAAAAAETAVRLGERTPELERLLANSDDLVAKLARIDEVIRIVREAEQGFRQGSEELRADLNEAMRLIEKEREERLQGYEKIQRQLRTKANV